MSIKIGYCAGKYTDKIVSNVKKNIEHAYNVGLEVMKLGAMPLIPHMNTAYMDGFQSADWWYEGTQELEKRCDFIVMCDGWEESVGSVAEFELAEKLGLPIFYENDLFELREWLANTGDC
jgi:hypothetical protein